MHAMVGQNYFSPGPSEAFTDISMETRTTVIASGTSNNINAS